MHFGLPSGRSGHAAVSPRIRATRRARNIFRLCSFLRSTSYVSLSLSPLLSCRLFLASSESPTAGRESGESPRRRRRRRRCYLCAPCHVPANSAAGRSVLGTRGLDVTTNVLYVVLIHIDIGKTQIADAVSPPRCPHGRSMWWFPVNRLAFRLAERLVRLRPRTTKPQQSSTG